MQVDEKDLIECGKALERALAILNGLCNLKEGVTFSDLEFKQIFEKATWESLGRGYIAHEPDQTYGAADG